MGVVEASLEKPWRLWELCRNRVILAAWLLFGLTAIFAHVHRLDDFQFYVRFGRAVLVGGNLYSNPVFDTATPFFNLFCVPLALLFRVSPYLAVASWSALNCVMILLLCDLCARLTYGRGLALTDVSKGVPLTDSAIFMPMILTLPYIINNFQLHQINLIIFWLTLYGLFWFEKGHFTRGGLAIGLAAAIKVMPVAFVPYLAWRGRWRAAFAAGVASVAFSLSPILVFGWRPFWNDAVSWYRVVHGGWHAGAWNQSILAMWDRIIGHKVIPFLVPGPRSIPWSGDPGVRIAWALTLAVIGVAALLAFRGRCPDSSCLAMEWSVVFLAAAIASPVAWPHYFVIMLLPNMLLYAIWRSPSNSPAARKTAGAVLGICFALGLLTGYGVVGSDLAMRFSAASVITDAVLIMMAALLWLRSGLKPAGDTLTQRRSVGMTQRS